MCECGKEVLEMYFDSLGYLHSARVSKCPKCGRIIDENSIAKNLIEVKIWGESEPKEIKKYVRDQSKTVNRSYFYAKMVPPAEPRKGERNEENELCRSDY